MKSLFNLLFFAILLSSVGYAQLPTNNTILEWNAGIVGSHNLKILGSATPECCFHKEYSNDKLSFESNYSITAEFQRWSNSSLKLGVGYSETGRDAKITILGDFIPTVTTTQGTVGIRSVYISVSYLNLFPINENNHIVLENGFALHKSHWRLNDLHLYSKSIFYTYLLKTGLRHHFNDKWSIASKVSMNAALVSQDTGDEYQPLSFGLELSLGYRL